MRGIIVFYYQPEAEHWNFAFISNERILFRGTIERAYKSDEEGYVIVESSGIGNFGTCYNRADKYIFGDFWADCDGYNRRTMVSLVKEAYPDAKITSVLGF